MLRTDKKIHIDWRWVGIGYCFIVVFLSFSLPIVDHMNIISIDLISTHGTIVILVAILETIVIAFYIGYRSKGKAIFEPGISAILFYGTMAVINPMSHYSILKTIGFYYFWAVVVFSYTSMSAWIGKLVQARKNRVNIT